MDLYLIIIFYVFKHTLCRKVFKLILVLNFFFIFGNVIIYSLKTNFFIENKVLIKLKLLIFKNNLVCYYLVFNEYLLSNIFS